MEPPRRGRLDVGELTGSRLDLDAVLFDPPKLGIQRLAWFPDKRASGDLIGQVLERREVCRRPH